MIEHPTITRLKQALDAMGVEHDDLTFEFKRERVGSVYTSYFNDSIYVTGRRKKDHYSEPLTAKNPAATAKYIALKFSSAPRLVEMSCGHEHTEEEILKIASQIYGRRRRGSTPAITGGDLRPERRAANAER